jgi:hypothetical protein
MALGAQVALTNTLPAVVLAGNPVPLKFEASTNLISSAGSKAEVILLWTAVTLADEYFDLLLAGQTVRFTCKTAPDNSGTEFHDNSVALTLANWVTLIASDLEKNYLIARYYDLSVDGAEITLTAKLEGSAYSQEFTAGPGIDVTPTETNKNGTDYTLEPFYYIVVLLYVGGEFVTEILLNVDESGLAEVDVSRYLQAFIESTFTWPEKPGPTEDMIRARADMSVEWNFLYGERWGDSEYQALQESGSYVAIGGGLSFRQIAKYNTEATTFWAQLQANKYFLSWAPLLRRVAPQEPIKLYYLNYSGATTIRVVAKSYFANGTDETLTIDSQEGVVDKGIYEILLGLIPFVDDGDISTENLIKVDVWLANQLDVVISEVRTFVVDYKEYPSTRYFIFKNSLGAYDVLRVTGILSSSEELSRETVVQDPGADLSFLDREEIDVHTSESRVFQASVGWLSRYGDAEEFRNWLRDFALSKEIYYAKVAYDNSGLQTKQCLVPIRLLNTSFDHGRDRDNLKGYSFEFTNAFTDEFFTKEITGNLANESFADDFELAQ